MWEFILCDIKLTCGCQKFVTPMLNNPQGHGKTVISKSTQVSLPYANQGPYIFLGKQ